MDESARGAEAHAQLGDAILQLREGVRRLCEEQVEGSGPDPQLVNALFRDAHSLKGLAGLFGEPQLVGLAHAAEDLLDGLRMGHLTLADEIEDLLLELPLALDDWLETGREGDLAARLRTALADVAIPEAVAAPSLPPELRRGLTTYEEHRVTEVLSQGRGLYAVRVELPIATFDTALGQLRADAARWGEILATLPVAEQPSPSEVACDLLLGSLRVEADLTAALGAGRQVRTLVSAKPGHAEAGSGNEPGTPARTVRIDIRRLDRMMEALDDLHLSRVSLGRIASRLQLARAPASLVAEVLHEARRIGRRIQEMQRAGLAVRMVPLSQLFLRTQRLAERLARDLGKEVEVRLEGEQVEVDKLLAEALAEPLVHLVHNAIDHGVERPEARLASGKPRAGTLRLRASQRGGMVILEVSDDGAGIDPAVVRKAAEARGLIPEGQPLDRSDVVRLLLTPGFSTAAGVGPISGRGVGLDAVRAKVVSFSGFLEVESQLGRGSAFTVALPATLALVRGLLVRSRGRRYALPVSAVWEIAALQPGYGARHRLPATGELVRLMPLADLFGLSSSSADSSVRPLAAIVGPPERRVGLVLDGLEGQRDLVMKPLGGALGVVPGIAGLAQLGPGEPVLILDVAALTDEALGRPGLRRSA